MTFALRAALLALLVGASDGASAQRNFNLAPVPDGVGREQALEVAGKIRFRPEIALTHLQLAELLLDAEGPNPPTPFPGKEGGGARREGGDEVGARLIAPVPSVPRAPRALRTQ